MIPFLDLGLVNKQHQARIHQAAERVLQSGWYVLGREVATFEAAFAQYCGVRHCIGVANGLEALTLVLKAWELPVGSEVIVPSNTYIASILAVTHAGLTPVLVEPDLRTYLLDASKIAAAITPRTKVILPVHLYGRCCEMAPIHHLAQKHGLRVLEDAAQAHGAVFQGQQAGALGDAAAWSFYPSKNLGAMGDAGAITTNDDALADKLRFWRNYGSGQKYRNEYIGHNSRLDELQAAILLAKFPYLDAENARRRQLATYYLNTIRHPALTLPPTDGLNTDVWHLFVVRHPQRDAFRAYLTQKGIGSDVHYPVPPHRQRAYGHLLGNTFPISEQIHREIVSLPLNPTLTNEDVTYIAETINSMM